MATVTRLTFELQGADGGPLRGDVRTASGGVGRPAVIICHGFKGFKDWGFFPHVAQRLARAGLTAVAFNFSGSGIGPDGETFSEPERFAHATFSRDLADIETVWSALTTGTLVPGLAVPTRVGVFGHSRGGGEAVLFAARKREGGSGKSVEALVTWAAVSSIDRWPATTIARWRERGSLDVLNTRTGQVLQVAPDILDDVAANRERLSIPRAAASIDVPWLIVHGSADVTVPPKEAEALHAAQPRSELLMIQGGNHGFGAGHPFVAGIPRFEQVMDATVDWFSRHLL